MSKSSSSSPNAAGIKSTKIGINTQSPSSRIPYGYAYDVAAEDDVAPMPEQDDVAPTPEQEEAISKAIRNLTATSPLPSPANKDRTKTTITLPIITASTTEKEIIAAINNNPGSAQDILSIWIEKDDKYNIKFSVLKSALEKVRWITRNTPETLVASSKAKILITEWVTKYSTKLKIDDALDVLTLSSDIYGNTPNEEGIGPKEDFLLKIIEGNLAGLTLNNLPRTIEYIVNPAAIKKLLALAADKKATKINHGDGVLKNEIRNLIKQTDWDKFNPEKDGAVIKTSITDLCNPQQKTNNDRKSSNDKKEPKVVSVENMLKLINREQIKQFKAQGEALIAVMKNNIVKAEDLITALKEAGLITETGTPSQEAIEAAIYWLSENHKTATLDGATKVVKLVGGVQYKDIFSPSKNYPESISASDIEKYLIAVIENNISELNLENFPKIFGYIYNPDAIRSVLEIVSRGKGKDGKLISTIPFITNEAKVLIKTVKEWYAPNYKFYGNEHTENYTKFMKGMEESFANAQESYNKKFSSSCSDAMLTKGQADVIKQITNLEAKNSEINENIAIFQYEIDKHTKSTEDEQKKLKDNLQRLEKDLLTNNGINYLLKELKKLGIKESNDIEKLNLDKPTEFNKKIEIGNHELTTNSLEEAREKLEHYKKELEKANKALENNLAAARGALNSWIKGDVKIEDLKNVLVRIGLDTPEKANEPVMFWLAHNKKASPEDILKALELTTKEFFVSNKPINETDGKTAKEADLISVISDNKEKLDAKQFVQFLHHMLNGSAILETKNILLDSNLDSELKNSISKYCNGVPGSDQSYFDIKQNIINLLEGREAITQKSQGSDPVRSSRGSSSSQSLPPKKLPPPIPKIVSILGELNPHKLFGEVNKEKIVSCIKDEANKEKFEIKFPELKAALSKAGFIDDSGKTKIVHFTKEIAELFLEKQPFIDLEAALQIAKLFPPVGTIMERSPEGKKNNMAIWEKTLIKTMDNHHPRLDFSKFLDVLKSVTNPDAIYKVLEAASREGWEDRLGTSRDKIKKHLGAMKKLPKKYNNNKDIDKLQIYKKTLIEAMNEWHAMISPTAAAQRPSIEGSGSSPTTSFSLPTTFKDSDENNFLSNNFIHKPLLEVYGIEGEGDKKNFNTAAALLDRMLRGETYKPGRLSGFFGIKPAITKKVNPLMAGIEDPKSNPKEADIIIKMMEEILLIKITQDQESLNKLLAIKGVIECTSGDRFWGKKNGKDIKGQNRLGQAWMRVRDILQSELEAKGEILVRYGFSHDLVLLIKELNQTKYESLIKYDTSKTILTKDGSGVFIVRTISTPKEINRKKIDSSSSSSVSSGLASHQQPASKVTKARTKEEVINAIKNFSKSEASADSPDYAVKKASIVTLISEWIKEDKVTTDDLLDVLKAANFIQDTSFNSEASKLVSDWLTAHPKATFKDKEKILPILGANSYAIEHILSPTPIAPTLFYSPNSKFSAEEYDNRRTPYVPIIPSSSKLIPEITGLDFVKRISSSKADEELIEVSSKNPMDNGVTSIAYTRNKSKKSILGIKKNSPDERTINCYFTLLARQEELQKIKQKFDNLAQENPNKAPYLKDISDELKQTIEAYNALASSVTKETHGGQDHITEGLSLSISVGISASDVTISNIQRKMEFVKQAGVDLLEKISGEGKFEEYTINQLESSNLIELLKSSINSNINSNDAIVFEQIVPTDRTYTDKVGNIKLAYDKDNLSKSVAYTQTYSKPLIIANHSSSGGQGGHYFLTVCYFDKTTNKYITFVTDSLDSTEGVQKEKDSKNAALELIKTAILTATPEGIKLDKHKQQEGNLDCPYFVVRNANILVKLIKEAESKNYSEVNDFIKFVSQGYDKETRQIKDDNQNQYLQYATDLRIDLLKRQYSLESSSIEHLSPKPEPVADLIAQSTKSESISSSPNSNLYTPGDKIKKLYPPLPSVSSISPSVSSISPSVSSISSSLLDIEELELSNKESVEEEYEKDLYQEHITTTTPITEANKSSSLPQILLYSPIGPSIQQQSSHFSDSPNPRRVLLDTITEEEGIDNSRSPSPTDDKPSLSSSSSSSPEINSTLSTIKEEEKFAEVKKYINGDTYKIGDPNVKAFAAAIESNEKNPIPTTPYRGIGVKVNIKEITNEENETTVTGLEITDIFSSDVPRFSRIGDGTSETLDEASTKNLKHQMITEVFVEGVYKPISKLFSEKGNERAKEEIAKIFHQNGPVKFRIGSQEYGCDNSKNKSAIFAPMLDKVKPIDGSKDESGVDITNQTWSAFSKILERDNDAEIKIGDEIIEKTVEKGMALQNSSPSSSVTHPTSTTTRAVPQQIGIS